MKVTIKQIASEANVSITTVSNVVNKRFHRVSKEKVALIEKIIEKYNYSPNMNARSLVQSSSQLVGVLYYSKEPDLSFSDPFISEVLSGINEQTKKMGYFSLVHNINSEDDIRTIQKNWLFEGFIVVGVSAKEFKKIDEIFDRPVVYIDTHLSKDSVEKSLENKERAFINTNDYEAAVLATEHLIKCGHSKIAFLSFDYIDDEPGVIEERYRGYAEAIKKAHLQIDKTHLYTDCEFEKIYEDLSQFSAIVVTGDFLAAKLIKFLKNKHVFSVEKLSIIGFDDISFSELMDPPLTTIRLDQCNKGKIAFEQLIKLVNNQEIDTNVILLDGKLINRRSVFNLK